MFACCAAAGGGERQIAGGCVDVPDDFVAQYIVGELLGAGATAVVHACERRVRGGWLCGRFGATPLDATPLVVKVIQKRKLFARGGLDQATSLIKQLRAEVLALRRLTSHRSILRSLEDFENGSVLLIVMERAMGGELFEQLVAHGRLSEAVASHLVGEIASGLEHCHAHGVIHRDLKPENLLLAAADDLRSGVKIADFGLASLVSHGETHAAKTFVGTPGYLAPEIRQLRKYDAKVDVWALGVIVYIMLSGRMPFNQPAWPLSTKASQPLRVLKADTVHFDKEPWKTNVSDQAKDFVWRCLAIQPELRLSSAGAARHRWLQATLSRAGKATYFDTAQLSSFCTRGSTPGHNASFFIEPNTVSSTKSFAETVSMSIRAPTKLRQLPGRGYRTPDSSPTHSLISFTDSCCDDAEAALTKANSLKLEKKAGSLDGNASVKKGSSLDGDRAKLKASLSSPNFSRPLQSFAEHGPLARACADAGSLTLAATVTLSSRYEDAPAEHDEADAPTDKAPTPCKPAKRAATPAMAIPACSRRAQ
ncbi:kinase-like domain-containing protein [Pelagophyceae sp. CCMP2097]|nr:kinase-like domain-containing protein [Pelagophyceae sp. CCMP2097]|mmetsp:Transcript_22119/g.74938  ORF Transcript_22119/g.74938 Transcript_22119/m.74938 type:complete len:536 (+) Transcript_22119:54-1661(+)